MLTHDKKDANLLYKKEIIIMPAPYSLDLREKVIHKIKTGTSPEDIMKIFNISRSTVYRWIKRSYLDILAPTPNTMKTPQKIVPAVLEDYIKNNPDATLKDIADKFEVSISSIYYRIKKLNYSYKKKSYSTQNEMKRKEQSSKKR